MDRWNYGWEDPRGYEQGVYGGGYSHEEVIAPRKPSLEEQLAQFEASSAQLQISFAQFLATQDRLYATLEAFNSQLQGSQDITAHSIEQFEHHPYQEPPFIIYKHDPSYDQVPN